MSQRDLETIGEYVLGLLEGERLSAFEARLAAEPDLARKVEDLRRHLQKLDDTAGTITPGTALWDRIAARLDEAPPALMPAPASRPVAANDNRWLRRMAMAASIVVALGVGYLSGTTLTAQRQPVMIAVLLTEDGAQPAAIVEAYADDSVQLVPLERFVLPAGRVFEVWTLPDAETGPVSLGTFNEPQTLRLAGPSLPPPQQGQLYEITLEPEGGSPTGRPTGPILVKGFARSPI